MVKEETIYKILDKVLNHSVFNPGVKLILNELHELDLSYNRFSAILKDMASMGYIDILNPGKEDEEAIHLNQKGGDFVYEYYERSIRGIVKPPVRGILFSNSETIDKLWEVLKGFFPGHEEDLKKVLNDEQVTNKLIFPHNQNKLVDVFRRLKDNSLCISNATEIRDWLCKNFQFHFKRGKVSQIRDLNTSTVWDLLTKAREETKTSKQRICNFDWLPYKKTGNG